MLIRQATASGARRGAVRVRTRPGPRAERAVGAGSPREADTPCPVPVRPPAPCDDKRAGGGADGFVSGAPGPAGQL